jgi:hypothetical protein
MICRTLGLGAAMLVAGCAVHPNKVPAQYVSSAPYEDMSCERLAREHKSLAAAIEVASDAQEYNANHDALMATVGLLAWPALFAIGGTGDRADQIGRLLGEHAAVFRAGDMKDCWDNPQDQASGQADLS